jgi:Ca2+-binding RTX toxin-like protein
MSGGVGNDIYFVNSAGDTVTELIGEGTDEVRVAGISYTLGNHVENLRTLSGPVSGTGNGLANEINGSNGNNTIAGLGNNDTLRGRGGSDTIDGGGGNDIIAGNAGQDFLTGGTGADRFVFTSITDSSVGSANAEVITDFNQAQGDRIQLNAIDAIAGGGDDPFAFIGTAAFTGTAGQLRYRIEGATGDTIVVLDVNGDGLRDMSIRLDGTHALVAGDFVL